MKKMLFLSLAMSGFLLASGLEVSLSELKFNYKEYSGGNVIDSESSSFNDLNGIEIKFIKNFEKFILNTNFEYNRGNTDYNGFVWDNNGDTAPFSDKDYNAYLYNLNIIGKYNLFQSEDSIGKSNIYILGGLGYRFWNRGSSDEEGDYDEKYKWPYYLLGGEIKEQFNKFNIGLQAYYQDAINPKMKAYLGEGATFDLGKTDGYRISVPIKYSLNANYGIVFRYIYDYWKISESNTKNITDSDGTLITGVYEPDSKTRNQYLNVGFYYNF